MVDTTYVDGIGPQLKAAWLNDVNSSVYRGLTPSRGTVGPAPTIASGFGTGAFVAPGSGSNLFFISTGLSSSAGVITMPYSPPTAWVCFVQADNGYTTSFTVATPSAGPTLSFAVYLFSTGAATTWPVGAILRCLAVPY